MFEKLVEWDKQTLIYLNNLGSEQFDAFWLITTNFLTWIPLFLFIIILLYRMYKPKEGFWVFLSFLSMLIVVTGVIFFTKEYFGRLRPVNDSSLNNLLRVLIKPSDYSFISGHAASSFAITTLAALYLKKETKWIFLLLLWPILFSFSRMYLGVHYPLDILSGMLVGTFFAWMFYTMHQKFRAPYIM
ncbi:phosphatase PAP2 family protein [Maribacter algarum]|uniref:Phosphatase PAP2 family protein n=1 Tax=Maribacter algarum (ex Zhang et al. 2020) TaxID=2578118 RepID=A0A5S3PNS2_9FLAO|nr:phosphatase PAP2 family protein [Maribacter algarum]TMM56128.1 phosphatase PAP2 family protein [Maribacter algarum]